jgi:hypothetical protein
MTPSSKLNTPVKRSFLLVLLFGILIQVVSVVVFLVDNRDGLFVYLERVVELPVLFRYWGREAYGAYRIAFWLSALLITVGLSCSIYYDQTFGRLVNWIRSGQF